MTVFLRPFLPALQADKVGMVPCISRTGVRFHF